MSFTQEQKTLIDRMVHAYSNDRGSQLSFADPYWENRVGANDIAIVNHIRDVIRFRPKTARIDPKDIEEFNRLFPQDRSEELLGKIKEVDRNIAALHLVGPEEDLRILKRERKELIQQLIEDLQQHLAE